MITLLARLFIPKNGSQAEIRKAYGILCGAAGVGLNFLLFLGKGFAGLLSGSVAVAADAFNNLSDAGSSFVTLFGFILAGRKPDAGHPFGHGRFEYLSGLAVAVLILLMGIELLRASVSKIFRPSPVDAGPAVVLILCVSVAVKAYMALYNRRLGKRLGSPAMEAASLDSLGDALATLAVLAAFAAGKLTSLPLDGWCGLLVALFILRSGILAVKGTLDPLLGAPPTPEFVEQVQTLALAHPGVIGVHDLIVHDYGPGRRMISLHAEVPASEDVLRLHEEIDRIERELHTVLGCEAVIHMDPIDTQDALAEETRRRVETLVHCIDDEISIHDFRMTVENARTSVIFDAVVPYRFRLTDQEVERKIKAAVQALDEGYCAAVTVERGYT